MNIGATIKQLRKEAKINQAELANLSGYTQTYISLMESGVRTVQVEALIKIARALNVSVAVIYVMAIGEDDIKPFGLGADPMAIKMLNAGKELILQALKP